MRAYSFRLCGWERRRSHHVPIAAILALVVTFAGMVRADVPEERFDRDKVLGTSFALRVRGVSEDRAKACEQAVLAEIGRLSGILHTGDPASEISRLCTASGTVECSADLFHVLQACDQWRKRTGGAFNPHVGGLIGLWQEAARTGRAPDAQQLTAEASKLKRSAWSLSGTGRAVTVLAPLNLKVAGLAKGYIIDRALAAGRGAAPDATGILLDIGGDIATWSASGKSSTWVVGVADPAGSEDNAVPMATVGLVNQSVATSGSYARGFTIGGKRYSHILDPRTGRPVATEQAATVVAKDTVTADALATALCVLPATRGVGLVNLIPNAECLIVGADGKKLTSRRWSLLAKAAGAEEPAAKPAGGNGDEDGGWPKGNVVTIKLNVKQQSRKGKRPYMAAWVVDKNGRPIKTLAVWGNKSKYYKKLSSWYRLGSSFREQARSVTRASRSAGVYTFAWDGTDRAGKPVPTGAYSVYIELVRDKGSHVVMTASIDCAGASDSATMRANAESDGASITYGPKGQ